MMVDAPRYIELVETDPEGLVDAAALAQPLPFGLEPRAFFRVVEDVHSTISHLNTALHEHDQPRLEELLDPAGFSGMLSRTVARKLAAASNDQLVMNAYHNGYPDLVRKGRYPRDSVQRGEGVEVKASRSSASWQSHGPREGWFVCLQFTLDARDIAAFEREPTRVEAILAAKLELNDWSWQPAREGAIRSGTATVKPSGRAKLRAGAIWVNPAYAEEHAGLLRAARIQSLDDAILLKTLRGSADALTTRLLADLVAPAIGLDDGAPLRGRVSKALARLVQAGAVVRVRRGFYRVAPD